MGTVVYQILDSRVSAKSVAIDLLSTMPARYPVAVGALVRAGAALGIGENSMRVALARLRANGLVQSDERGLYRLSAAAEPVNRQVRAWRVGAERARGEWDGTWIGVETGAHPRRDRKHADKQARALRFLGFEALTVTLQIRPNNLEGGVSAVRDRLASLGYTPSPIVFQLADLDPDTDARARALWDSASLEAGYAELRDALAASSTRLPTLSTNEAMAESFRLGGEAVRRIVLDPLLPAAIVDEDARRALVDEMTRYDRIGRECWKSWAGESVEPERTPADVSGLATAQVQT